MKRFLLALVFLLGCQPATAPKPLWTVASQGYSATPGPGGVQVRDLDGGWQVDLGFGSERIPTQGPGRLETDLGDGLTGWLVPSAEGLQQGWTATQPTRELLLPVSVGNASVELLADAKGAVFRTDGATLHYTGLKAWDAGGVELDARLEPSPAGLAVRVQTGDAAFPVTVDPVLTVAVWDLAGTTANATFGFDAQGAGDVNGDGYGDVLVGAPLYPGGGALFLYLGGPTGPSTTPVWFTTGQCELGIKVAGLGDLNGDGLSDFGAGDPCATVAASSDGAVFVWYGSTNPAGLTSVAPTTLTTGQAGASTGEGLAGAGDVNGDGYADVIVGAPAWSSSVPLQGEGAAWLYLGGASGLDITPAWSVSSGQAGADSGEAVDGAGDVNGDGFADVLVGEPLYDSPASGAGRARLFLGSGVAPFLTEVFTVNGSEVGGNLGSAVAGVGDIDGDGYSDIAIGEDGFNSGTSGDLGRFYVYTASGGTIDPTPTVVTGVIPFQSLGNDIDGLGDVNGDGYGDIAVGGIGQDRGYVFLGGPNSIDTTARFTFVGPNGAGFGGSADAAGDVNGDGLADVVFGGAFAGVSDQGTARIYLGARSGPEATDQSASDGPAPAAAFGTSLAWLGDVDGNGYADLLVGGEGYDGGQAGEGGAWIYGGTAAGLDWSSPIWSGESDQPGAGYGRVVATLGDVNGDGYSDWAVGSDGWDEPAFADAGKVLVYLGGPAPLNSAPSWEQSGTATGERFGSDVAGGDLDGDGYADLAIGIRAFSNPEAGEGAVFVWLGGVGGLGVAADWSAESDEVGAQLGSAVAVVGDVNGDGYADLVGGAPEYVGTASGQGQAFLWLGAQSLPASPSWSVTGALLINQVGASVAGVGDVNGDGLDDVAIGAPTSSNVLTEEGAVLLFEGEATSSGLGAVSAVTYFGDNSFSGFGSAVAAAGDLDGDGLYDVAVGSPSQFVGRGILRVFGGDASSYSLSPIFAVAGGIATSDGLGSAVVAADVNGDGYADLLGGSPGYDATPGGNEGRVTVWRGNTGDGRGDHPLAPALQAGSIGAPIAAWGRAPQAGSFAVSSAAARSSQGRAGIGIEIEAKPSGTPFDGTLTTVQMPGTYTDSTVAGASTVLADASQGSDTAVHWRARLRFDPSDSPPTLWGPWTYGGRTGEDAVHLRTGCLSDLDLDGLCDAADLDDDGDGQDAVADGGLDCDDADPAIFSGAVEVCDGVDSDCDGSLVDEDPDTDTDGEPDCTDLDDDGDGSADGDDCSPLDADAFPGNPEICDGTDNDCDGSVPGDELDGDADTFRPCNGDCDDGAPTVFPGAPELLDCVDNDCDGSVPAVEFADSDSDGAPACRDCLESDPSVFVGALEICDGIKNDCDDADDPMVVPADEVDDDADGFAECEGDCDDADATAFPGASETSGSAADLNCDGVTGTDVDGDGVSVEDGDCDDDEPGSFPGATEICDGLDNDCDGVLTPGEADDVDGDGALACLDCNEADPNVFPGADESCDGWDSNCDGYVGPDDIDVDGDGWAVCAGDCDDGDPDVHPGRTEDAACSDGVDNDCDGSIDVNENQDGDSAGTCDGDCDDDDPLAFPGAADDQCDGVDNDCDGVVDGGADVDLDGWADCGPGTDCDDDDPAVFPGAPELCDGTDTDCDPLTNPYVDADGDGVTVCPEEDCNDEAALVFPGAPELCDGLDNDCDGVVDNTLDTDGDGLTPCTGDCFEGEPSARAGFDELCDGIDNDCDRTTDEDCTGTLDIVFPAGCVCDASAPLEPRGALLLLLLLPAMRRRRLSPRGSRSR
ncbi:MAG: FG-GAP repeat protein [Deltaproteobacteria bacterium]|nr:FG-GAP repeat protein [Deltaproteobacteria bacterium]